MKREKLKPPSSSKPLHESYIENIENGIFQRDIKKFKEILNKMKNENWCKINEAKRRNGENFQRDSKYIILQTGVKFRKQTKNSN